MCLMICAAAPPRNLPFPYVYQSEAEMESMSRRDAAQSNKVGKAIEDKHRPAFKHSQIVNVIALPETQPGTQELTLPQSPYWYQHYFYFSYFQAPSYNMLPYYESYRPVFMCSLYKN